MWAGGTSVDSVNDGMDRSAWPANRLVRVRELAEAAGIMQGAEQQRATLVEQLGQSAGDREFCYEVIRDLKSQLQAASRGGLPSARAASGAGSAAEVRM